MEEKGEGDNQIKPFTRFLREELNYNNLLGQLLKQL
jgi:hypothetical protein